MGDKDPKAKWDRSSDVIAMSKDTRNPMGCIHCHDAHGAGPRIIRDALIDAVDQQGAKMFARDGKTDLKVIDFRGFRKIGVMAKTDSRLMCAQCHVEYACNAGLEFDSGKRLGYDDRRTNLYPLVNARDILEAYKKVNFYDFRHAVTGARLVKLQHPEAETYSGSIHDKAGVQCHQCHMPKAKSKAGATYTNPGVVRPIQSVKEACLVCHAEGHGRAENLPDRGHPELYQGEDAEGRILARPPHRHVCLGEKGRGSRSHSRRKRGAATRRAHVLWEWWTAENSDGWHNPDLARETLAASIIASKKGIDLLTNAMAAAAAATKK